MPRPAKDPELVRIARHLRHQEKMTIEAITKKMQDDGHKVSFGWVRVICLLTDDEAEAYGQKQIQEQQQALEKTERSGFVGDDNSGVATIFTEKPIQTLEDAVEAANIDLSVWRVDKWECGQWTTALNLKEGEKGKSKAALVQQYRVKVFLKRVVPRHVREALDFVYAKMRKHAPRYPKLVAKKKSKGSCLAVFGLFDAHFGKLAWEPETGNNYDLSIAEELFRNAAEDLLLEASHRDIGRILLPLGNDFFHIDNKKNTTFHGTPQDVDSRYPKIFAAGKLATIWAIEMLAAQAPVDVIWVPGNHDPTTSFHLAETVASWFRNCSRVSVDVGASARKYYTWGETLLGFTHGDVMKPESLPSLMATEKPQEWGASKCREWLIGHQHCSRHWTTKSVDTHRGTVVRVLRALTGTDAWHFENGFVGAQQAAEVYFYEKQLGYVGHGVAAGRRTKKR